MKGSEVYRNISSDRQTYIENQQQKNSVALLKRKKLVWILERR